MTQADLSMIVGVLSALAFGVLTLGAVVWIQGGTIRLIVASFLTQAAGIRALEERVEAEIGAIRRDLDVFGQAASLAEHEALRAEFDALKARFDRLAGPGNTWFPREHKSAELNNLPPGGMFANPHASATPAGVGPNSYLGEQAGGFVLATLRPFDGRAV